MPDPVFLITGASTGIGAATARHAVRAGYRVVLAARSHEKLDALRETRGHVLLTGSIAGRRVLPGSFYSCTKHAVTAMAEAARQDLDGSGVRVTLLCPRHGRDALLDAGRPPARSPPTTSPKQSCTPSPARRTSTSTRSWCGRSRSRRSPAHQ